MSIHSTSAISDISEFAAWEQAHPLPEGEVHEQSREQSLIDMAEPERIWPGEDSSNDGRESDAEEAPEGNVEAVVVEVEKDAMKLEIPSSTQTSLGLMSSPKSNGTVRPTVKGHSQDLQGRRLEPESDVDVPPSSQPRDESEDEDIAEDSNAEVVLREEAEESIVKNNGTMDLEIESPPIDTPMPRAIDTVVLDEDPEDLLDGFDIAPEDKEFLLELLPQASQEERGLLQLAKASEHYNGGRRLSTFQDEAEFVDYLKASVQDFAKEHPFWTQEKWEEDDLVEFETDVNEFAIAAGMKDSQADEEAITAVKLWKLHRAMDVIAPITSALAPIIVAVAQTMSMPALPLEAEVGVNKKRKREGVENSGADSTISENGGNDAERAKKRRKEEKKTRQREMKLLKAQKLAADIAAGIVKPPPPSKKNPPKKALLQAQNDPRKQTKKEKKLASKEKLNQDQITGPGAPNEKLKLQSSADWYAQPLAMETTTNLETEPSELPTIETEAASSTNIEAPDIAASGAENVEMAIPAKKAKREKKPKQPTTSAYFSKPSSPAVESSSGSPSGETPDLETSGKSAAEILAAKIIAAKESVQNALKQLPKKPSKRMKKRNNNKLPKEKVQEPIGREIQESVTVIPVTLDMPTAKKPEKSAAAARRQKKIKKRQQKRVGTTAGDIAIAAGVAQVALPISKAPPVPKSKKSQGVKPEAVSGVKADGSSMVTKTTQSQTGALESKQPASEVTETKSEGARSKRARNRKPKVEHQQERDQAPVVTSTKPVLKSVVVEAKDTTMSNTAKALSEIANPNPEKKARRQRSRKSGDKKEIEASKAHHL